MAKKTPIDKQREDGSWFLEAVGVKESPPSSIESIAQLELENTLADTPVVKPDVPLDTSGDDEEPSAQLPPDPEPVEGVVIEMTSFDGDPGTTLSTFDPVPELPPVPSNVAVAIPPISTTQSDILSQSVDESKLSAPLRTRRPFRWPVLGLAVAVIAAIVLAMTWLPKAADSAASATRTSYYDASLSVREYLPTAQASLDIVTRPSSTDAALGSVIPVVSELTSLASNLATTAAEPLPSVLPFLSSDAVDELPPLQDRSAILASDTAEVARQIGHAYVYRTSITDLLDSGDLPTTAGTDEINALSVTLATSLAENASLIADLPSNTAFDEVASAAADAVGAYAQWQDEYLAALADGDAPAAEALISDIARVRAALISDTERALGTFRDILDDRIVSLSVEFDQHLVNLTQ